MDIYLTDLETGSSLRFPMVPEKITVKAGPVHQSYAIMAIGTVKLPAGEELTEFSWSGMLPGGVRSRAPYVAAWSSPSGIQQMWDNFQAKKKKLRLLITETPVNYNVYMGPHSVDYSGGHGDYYYSITLVQAKDLIVYQSKPAAVDDQKKQESERPSPPSSKTYTVKKGDSLWAISQKFLGGGSNYPSLYDANKDVVGSNPNLIYPGQVLTIPG